jgi:uncharacterized metal-binding protein
MTDTNVNCARCPYKSSERLCRTEDGKAPPFCPTQNKADVLADCLTEYDKPEVRELARQAALQEADGYGNRDLGYARLRPIKTRMEEVIEFSQKMNFERLGLAFCAGLANEAKAVEQLLSEHGFEVVSALCKAGRTPKERIGITDDQKLAVGQFESMCNPIFQAYLLNDGKTDFNILLGLCVGHDSLFLKYGEAPCTVLAVKDRVLCHNPLAAVYTKDSYYRSLKNS